MWEAQLISHRSQIIPIYWETSSLMTTHGFQVNKYVPDSILCYPSWNCSFWTPCFIYPKAISRHNFAINKNPHGLLQHQNTWGSVLCH